MKYVLSIIHIKKYEISIKQLGTGEKKTLSRKTGLCKGPMREETAEQKKVSAHVRNCQAGQDALTDGSYGQQDYDEVEAATGVTPGRNL